MCFHRNTYFNIDNHFLSSTPHIGSSKFPLGPKTVKNVSSVLCISMNLYIAISFYRLIREGRFIKAQKSDQYYKNISICFTGSHEWVMIKSEKIIVGTVPPDRLTPRRLKLWISHWTKVIKWQDIEWYIIMVGNCRYWRMKVWTKYLQEIVSHGLWSSPKLTMVIKLK